MFVISTHTPTTLTTSDFLKSWLSRRFRWAIGTTAVSNCITMCPSAQHAVQIPWNKAAADDFVGAGMAPVAHLDSNAIRIGELTEWHGWATVGSRVPFTLATRSTFARERKQRLQCFCLWYYMIHDNLPRICCHAFKQVFLWMIMMMPYVSIIRQTQFSQHDCIGKSSPLNPRPNHSYQKTLCVVCMKGKQCHDL